MISTRARYAIHGLCYLARIPGTDPIPFPRIVEYLRDWSAHLTLSPSYIGKIFQDLSRSRLVRAMPGRKGGYRLARPAKDLTLLDVVRAIEGVPSNDCCLLSVGECSVQDHCGLIKLVNKAQDAYYGTLEKETIDGLSRKMAFPIPPEKATRSARTGRSAPKKAQKSQKRR
jgi:Rrf2 family protein